MNFSFPKYVFSKTIPTYCVLLRKSYSKSIKTPTNYCIEMVRSNEHENFLCTLLLPDDVRQAGFAVRAFNIEVAKVSEHTKEKHIVAMRMKFWSDTLDQIYKNSPPQHPVALELARVVSKHRLLKKHLKRLITARAELPSLRFDSIADMERYCEETVSPIYYLLLQAAGSKTVDADHAGSHLGKAQGLATLLRSLPHNISSRSLPLPSDLLAQHKVSQESVLRGSMSNELGEVLFEVASAAKIHLNKARSLQEKIKSEYCVIFLPAVATDAYLERLRFFDFDAFNPSLQNRNTNLGFKLFWSKLRKNF